MTAVAREDEPSRSDTGKPVPASGLAWHDASTRLAVPGNSSLLRAEQHGLAPNERTMSSGADDELNGATATVLVNGKPVELPMTAHHARSLGYEVVSDRASQVVDESSGSLAWGRRGTDRINTPASPHLEGPAAPGGLAWSATEPAVRPPAPALLRNAAAVVDPRTAVVATEPLRRADDPDFGPGVPTPPSWVPAPVARPSEAYETAQPLPPRGMQGPAAALSLPSALDRGAERTIADPPVMAPEAAPVARLVSGVEIARPILQGPLDERRPGLVVRQPNPDLRAGSGQGAETRVPQGYAAQAELEQVEAQKAAQQVAAARAAEARRIESERAVAAERFAAERFEAERAAAIEAQRVEAQRVETQRVEALRAAAARAAEARRIESEQAAAAERVAAERFEAERAAAMEAQRVEGLRVEAQRVEALRVEALRVEAERASAMEAQRVEAQQVAAARVAEARRLEAEQAAAAAQARQFEAERGAAVEAQRVAMERFEAERAAAIEAQRLDAERAAEDRRREMERFEAERAAAIEAQRLEIERMEAEREAQTAQSSAPVSGSDSALSWSTATWSPPDVVDQNWSGQDDQSSTRTSTWSDDVRANAPAGLRLPGGGPLAGSDPRSRGLRDPWNELSDHPAVAPTSTPTATSPTAEMPPIWNPEPTWPSSQDRPEVSQAPGASNLSAAREPEAGQSWTPSPGPSTPPPAAAPDGSFAPIDWSNPTALAGTEAPVQSLEWRPIGVPTSAFESAVGPASVPLAHPVPEPDLVAQMPLPVATYTASQHDEVVDAATEASAIRATLPTPGADLLVARNLIRRFRRAGRTVEALAGVDLTLRQGELVTIIGASGSGKSTLLACLAGLDHVDSGEVVLHGERLSSLTDGERAQQRAEHMGFVFASNNLVPVFTAIENVEVPLLLSGWSAAEARAEALAVIEFLGLADRAEHLPNELSAGEQQRVAIARAVAGRPQIIWADEPTASLDEDAAVEVVRQLLALNRNGATVVIVTHDPEIAELAHRRVQMRNGRIVGITDFFEGRE